MACNCSKKARNLFASPTVRQIRESGVSYYVIFSNGTESNPYSELRDARVAWRSAKLTDSDARLVERRV